MLPILFRDEYLVAIHKPSGAGLPLTLTAPLAADFCRLLGRLGWDGVVAQRWLPDQHGSPGG